MEAGGVKKDWFSVRPHGYGSILAVAIGLMSLCLLFPLNARADVYRYVDKQGTIHFTNVPDNRKFKLWIRETRVLLKPGLGNVKYDTLIAAAAERHKVDYALIKAIIKAESNFDHRAVSPKGAQGLMQLMPQTASSLQVRDSFEPEDNIEGGVRYLRYLINVYDGAPSSCPCRLQRRGEGCGQAPRHPALRRDPYLCPPRSRALRSLQERAPVPLLPRRRQ